MGRRWARAAAAAVVGWCGAVTAQDLPSTMIWSTYDAGSSGYAEASAVADALSSAYDTRIRLLPSGTSIGRLLPLREKRVDTGWLANEVFFATEGVYDFATRDWGPQDLRVLSGRPAAFGIFTTADSGIASLADLKGKTLAYVAANPSINLKVDAILAFAGLSPDDVEIVEYPGYGPSLRAVMEGNADAAGGVTTSGLLFEIESARGLVWLPMDADDGEGWANLNKLAPIFAPVDETVGAGVSEEAPVTLMGYRYPMLTVYADADAEAVYALVKAMDETFDAYKDATGIMHRWDKKLSGEPPVDAPFHEGAIRYYQETGQWDERDQAWQDTRQARLDALIAAWRATLAEGDGLDDAAFAELWQKKRAAALAGL